MPEKIREIVSDLETSVRSYRIPAHEATQIWKEFGYLASSVRECDLRLALSRVASLARQIESLHQSVYDLQKKGMIKYSTYYGLADKLDEIERRALRYTAFGLQDECRCSCEDKSFTQTRG